MTRLPIHPCSGNSSANHQSQLAKGSNQACNCVVQSLLRLWLVTIHRHMHLAQAAGCNGNSVFGARTTLASLALEPHFPSSSVHDALSSPRGLPIHLQEVVEIVQRLLLEGTGTTKSLLLKGSTESAPEYPPPSLFPPGAFNLETDKWQRVDSRGFPAQKSKF